LSPPSLAGTPLLIVVVFGGVSMNVLESSSAKSAELVALIG
jgi:hypothetical protein